MTSTSDRSLILREIRTGIVNAVIPEISSAQTLDLAAHIDRLLTMLILDEEQGEAMGARYAAELREALALLQPGLSLGSQSFDALRDTAQRAIAETMSDKDLPDERRDAITRIMAIETRYQNEIAELRENIRASLPASGQPAEGEADLSVCTFSATALTNYLRDTVPGAGKAEVGQLIQIPGGRSKETVIVDMVEADSLPSSFIVRKDRAFSVTDATVVHEFELLKAVSNAGNIPVPEPLWIERDASRLGSPFMLVTRLRGTKQGEYHLDMWRPAHDRRAIAMQIAATLAHIHAVPLDALSATHLDLKPDLSARIAGHIDRIDKQFAGSDGLPSISAAVAGQWLRSHVEWGLLARPALVHGDFGLHNLLIEDGRLTGVVDWELASIGSPAIDVAMCRRMAPYMDFEWQDFVDTYVDAGGAAETCDPRSIAFYQVYGLVSGTVRSRYGGHLFRSGVKRDLVTANSGFDFHYRSSRLLANALTEAMALDRAPVSAQDAVA